MVPRNYPNDMKVRHWPAYGLALTLIALLLPQPATALDAVLDVKENPGDLLMYLHRPAEFRAGLPVVVALHGCLQTAADFDDETGLVALAEETPFLLLLPEQRPENMSRRCFRWHDADNNRNGKGESASILAMIDNVLATQGADPDKVFVLGFSAGGAMASVLIANYPGRFAGGAVLAGLPFDCNRPTSDYDVIWNALHYSPFVPDGSDAIYACGIGGYERTDRDAEEWASFVTQSAADIPDDWPLISLWHGTGDETVDPDNLQELTEQWTAAQGIDAIVDERQEVGGATRELYRDQAGNLRLETWSLPDFIHAVPIDVDGSTPVCGQETDFVKDAGVCAIRHIIDFWRLK